ncbi:MAG: UvrD-helicase domain-containing protein, partial [Candidatus Glassbacteria bacterium]
MTTPFSPLDGLNPDQVRAVTSTARRLLVLAGAGSGKTFVITRRILHLVAARSVNPANVLAITFTRNAAREMARRL